jgi:hypothetical protein
MTRIKPLMNADRTNLILRLSALFIRVIRVPSL